MNALTPFNPDADFDPGLDPYHVSSDDITRAGQDFRSETRTQVNQGLEADPDDAAEAVNLSQLTGTPAPWVMHNLDEQKQQVRQATAQQLVLSNPALVSYLQSHPMAASVSNDDWANLDQASEDSSKLAALHRVLNAPFDKIGQAELEGIQSGWQGADISQEYAKATDPAQNQFGEAGALAASATYGTANLLLKTMGAIFGGIAGAAKGAGEQIGGPQLGRETGAMAEYEMMRGDQPMHGEGAETPLARAPAKPSPLVEAMGKAAPWMEAGLEPPAGLHPLIDQAKAQMNQADLDLMDQALKSSLATNTHERSAELTTSFQDQFHKDARFEIWSDAALGLYGDKPPSPDDGLLGWVPDIESQLTAAREMGQGVSVKISDWLTHVEPEVAKTLHDDIRMWPGGITAREAKEPPVESKEVINGLSPTIEAVGNPITHAAILFPDGKLFTGLDHSEILNQIESQDNIYSKQIEDNKSRYGFVTRDGQFISHGDAEAFHGIHSSEDILYGRPSNLKAARDSAQSQRANLEYTQQQFESAKKNPNTSPDIIKGLEEDVRNSKHDIARIESRVRNAELAQDTKPVPTQRILLDGPMPQVRDVAGLEPKFAMGDRKLTLQKGALEGAEGAAEVDPYYDGYHMLDEHGQPVGELAISAGEDKTLFVHWIGGQAGLWSNNFGPSLMRDIKRQLKTLYPDYDYISGFRVSGAREISGANALAKVKLYVPDLVESLNDHEAMQDIFQNGWRRFNERVETNPQDASFYSPEQLAAGQAAQDEIERIAPGADVQGTAGIRKTGTDRRAQGLYQAYPDRPPTILYDLLSQDTVGVGRHEAVHYLKDYGFFKPEEWSALESAAKSEGWLDRYGINERYAHLDEPDKLEEGIAEAFREWARQAPEIRPKTGVGAVFQKLWDFLDRVRQRMGEALGRTPTWEEVFERTHSGEVGQRGPGEPAREGAFDLREKYAIEGDDNLRAQAVGLPVDSFRKLQEGYRKRNAEDLEAAIARNKKIEERNQSKEWRANRVDMAKEVASEIRQRPDIAADAFVGSGELGGKKLQQRYTLRADDFTPEQRAAMPEHYTSKNGLPADQVAGMFGYGSKDELASALAGVHALRTTAEGDRIGGRDFLRQLVQSETDRRMEARYGDQDDNVMDAATDRALSQTNINVMHQDLMAAAQQGGVTVFDKEVMQAAAKRYVGEMALGKVSSYRLMQGMGQASRVAEKALLSKDFATAAKAMQQQTLMAMVAKEARAVEKEAKTFDKTAKQFSKRDIPSMEPEYTNWVHTILQQIGKPVKRSAADLAQEIGAAGSGEDTLGEFVQNKTAWLQALPVWDKLFDGKWQKGYKDLTVAEFRSVRDSVKTLVHNGREEHKLIAAGTEADRAEKKAEMIDTLGQFKQREVNETGGTLVTRLPRAFLANTLQMENVLNRWDRFDPRGVWNQYVLRDLIDGVNQSDAWKKEAAGKLAKLKDIDDMHANVMNPGLFRAPAAYGGRTLTLNREAMHSIMLNMGNDSNLAKMAKGWGVDPEAIRAWVGQNATKADWDRVQAIWDLFDEHKDRSDTMYRSIAGVPAQRIEAKPVATPHGTYRGGYYPMIYHPTYEGTSRKLMGNVGLMGEGFDGFDRTAPGAGYENERTGYSAPTALTLDQMPNRLSQMIHNTALRPAVLNAAKVFKDPEIRAAITTHYGKEYTDLLVPYLRGVANASNSIQKEGAWLNGVSEFMRQNLITSLVGLNPGTVLKHGPTAWMLSMNEVGPGRFFNAVHGLMSVNDETGDKNWTFAIKNSLELQRRDRNWQENLYGATGELQAGSKFGKWRQRIMQWSSWPVALSDMASAVPTWMAQYDKGIEEGLPHGDAVSEADRAVRRAHGSTAVTNRPALTNQISPWLTSFYNFFNDVFNRQAETLWRAGDELKLPSDARRDTAMKVAGTAAAGMFAYAIWPAIVESWVSPQPSSPQDSWGKKAAKGLLFTEGATVPVIRDIVNGFLDAKDPDVGLLSTEGRALFDIARDFGKGAPFNQAHAQKTIRDASGFVGALTGIPQQAGREISAGVGVTSGIDRPRGPWGWLVLGRYGTLKGHSQTLEDYMAGRSSPSR